MPQLTALREFPGPNTGRRNGSWVSQTPWQEVMKLTVWWTKVGRDHRLEPWRGERGTERKRTLEIWGGAPRVFSRGRNRAHLGETTWDQEETIWKDYRNLWLVLTQSQEFYLFSWAAAAAAKSLQSCLTLGDPIDSSLPGTAIPGILQARTLEWVAISFSNSHELGWEIPRYQQNEQSSQQGLASKAGNNQS